MTGKPVAKTHSHFCSSCVTPDHKKAFDRDGVVHLKGALSKTEIDLLRCAVDRQVAGLGERATTYDFQAIADAVWEDRPIDEGGASRFDFNVLMTLLRTEADRPPLWDDIQPESYSGDSVQKESGSRGSFVYDAAEWTRDDGVKRVALDSRLPEIAATLLEATYLNFWEDTTFVKQPWTRQRSAFHQDLNYFQIDGDQCVIVWIPLDPATQESGSLEVVAGSHKWKRVFKSNTFISQTPIPASEGERLPDIEGNRSDYRILCFNVEPGDVVICHVRAVHGSGGNKTSNPRRAMSFRYVGDKVRYREKPGALNPLASAHGLKSGDRIFSDAYPMAWPPDLKGLSPSELRLFIGDDGKIQQSVTDQST